MRTNPLITLLLYIFVAINIYGCAYTYVPNVVNAPQFKNKGEIQASVSNGTAGWDPQVAYALTKNIGVMFNGSFANSKSSDLKYHKHKFGEFGLGYFHKTSENFGFSIYSGYGIGNLTSRDNDDFNKNTNYRIFIQPSFGFSNKLMDLSVTVRANYFSQKRITLNENESIYQNDLFLEPVITTKIGPKYLKAIFQFGLSLNATPLSLQDENHSFDYQPLIFSIGLQAYLFRKYKTH